MINFKVSMKDVNLLKSLINEIFLNEKISSQPAQQEMFEIINDYNAWRKNFLKSVQNLNDVKNVEKIKLRLLDVPENYSEYENWLHKEYEVKGFKTTPLNTINYVNKIKKSDILVDFENWDDKVEKNSSGILNLSKEELEKKLSLLENGFVPVKEFLFSEGDKYLENIVSTYFGDPTGESLTGANNKYELYDLKINDFIFEIKKHNGREIPTGFDGRRAASTFYFQLRQFIDNFDKTGLSNKLKDEIKNRINRSGYLGKEYIEEILNYFISINIEENEASEQYKIGNTKLTKKVYDAVSNYLLRNFQIKVDNDNESKSNIDVHEYSQSLKHILSPENSFRSDIKGVFIVKSPNLLTYIKKEDLNNKLQIKSLSKAHRGPLTTCFDFKK